LYKYSLTNLVNGVLKMSKSSEAVKKWRETTKTRMVESLGGKCVCCGYNRNHWALEFHHVDPSQKLFSLGGMRANPRSWGAVVEELRKCVILCSNCHREVEHGSLKIPSDCTRFNESFVTYERKSKLTQTNNLSDKNYSLKKCMDCGKNFEVYKGRSIRCIGCRNIVAVKYSTKIAHEKRLQ